MMRVFQVKGFAGLMTLVLILLGAVALFVLLPASFMMVLWNAVVYEGFNGVEINFVQGLMLWSMMLIVLNLVFKPQISFQIRKEPPTDLKKRSK
jgi:hypothetical protein